MKNFIKWQLCNLLLWYNWQKNIFLIYRIIAINDYVCILKYNQWP